MAIPANDQSTQKGTREKKIEGKKRIETKSKILRTGVIGKHIRPRVCP